MITPSRLFLILVVLLLITTGSSIYFWWQWRSLDTNSYQAGQVDVAATVAAVGQLIELPTNEEPTIATVSEPEKLKGQAFFAKAKAGDQVLVYTKAQKAILYDPAANKIIEVAPLNINQ